MHAQIALCSALSPLHALRATRLGIWSQALSHKANLCAALKSREFYALKLAAHL